MTGNLLSKREAARRFGVSARTVEKWQQNGKLPFVKISATCVRFREEDVERFIAERLVKSTSDQARKSGDMKNE